MICNAILRLPGGLVGGSLPPFWQARFLMAACQTNANTPGFAGDFTSLYAADGLPVGFEGCSILKHNGKYYLTAATYNQSYDASGRLITTYDSMIAVSDNLMDPYSETRLLLRNGGHNNLFVDKDGTVWTTLFAPTGDLGFNCQPAIVPLTEDERGILSVESED